MKNPLKITICVTAFAVALSCFYLWNFSFVTNAQTEKLLLFSLVNNPE